MGVDSSDREARYWEARSQELEKRLRELRDRWVALAAILPPDALELLQMPIEEVRARATEAAEASLAPDNGLEDRFDFVSSDVKTEIELALGRLKRGGENDA